MQVSLDRKLVAEALGTALLVAAVIGSGIMAQQLAKDPALALLCRVDASGGAVPVEEIMSRMPRDAGTAAHSQFSQEDS